MKRFARKGVFLVLGVADRRPGSLRSRGCEHEEDSRPAFRSASCCRTRSRRSAGCSSTRRTSRRRIPEGRHVGAPSTTRSNDPSKQTAQAQACLAAGAKVVIETALDNGSGFIDREALHVEGRLGDRLRPPGHRRHRLGLRHVRRQGRRRGAGQGRHRRDEGEGHVQAEQHGRRALGRPDRPERVLVQERQRRRSQPALQEAQAEEGPAAVRARLGREQRGDNLRARCWSRRTTTSRASSRRTTTSPAPSSPARRPHHLKPVPLSGQDATAQGVQYILAGWQTGTVYKYVPLEANAAAAAAVKTCSRARSRRRTRSGRTGKKEPTLALPVTWITKKNYKHALQAEVAEEERRVHRSVQEVLQVELVHCEMVGAPASGASTVLSSPRSGHR